MQGKFEYLPSVTMSDCLFVDDIGNCCIRVIDNVGAESYLCISTVDTGMTYVLSFGKIKVINDEPVIGGKPVSIEFYSFIFSERRINKIIRQHVMQIDAEIAEVINIRYALSCAPNVVKHFSNMIGLEVE